MTTTGNTYPLIPCLASKNTGNTITPYHIPYSIPSYPFHIASLDPDMCL